MAPRTRNEDDIFSWVFELGPPQSNETLVGDGRMAEEQNLLQEALEKMDALKASIDLIVVALENINATIWDVRARS